MTASTAARQIERLLAGEQPYYIFVRWNSLHEQATDPLGVRTAVADLLEVDKQSRGGAQA